MPAGREKLVHALGAVAKVEFLPDASTPYTGMFKGGVGVIRMSLAKDPGADGFVPGVALKLMSDGIPSANMEVMLSIDGQGANFDFFANTFSNIIPDAVGFGSKIIVNIFSKVSATPGHLDVNGFAAQDRRGRAVSAPVAPAQVFFVPAASVRAVPRRNSPDVDFREDLAAIPDGSTLYDVYGAHAVGEAPSHIGTVITRSEVISSRFGDEGLFFKHEKHAD